MIQGTLYINDFTTERGEKISNLPLTYEFSGAEPGTAPIVVVNHALTGNSHVTGTDGWWGDLIGSDKAITTEKYTILCFDIPGNCYRSEPLPNAELFTLKDIAKIFLTGIDLLKINRVKAIIGASLGGALTWQLAYLSPKLAEYIIPIASDFVARDWLLAQTELQKILLKQSQKPLHAARIHGMLCYRTPLSINQRFNGKTTDEGEPQVINWLHFHGRQLQKRFSLSAYEVMTYLTSSICVTNDAKDLRKIESKIFMVSINSDLLFPHTDARKTASELGIELYTIDSPHGHDAFLIEYEQLSSIISPLFND